MASVLAGFRPVKHMNGSPYNGQFNRYMVSASEATALNVGDLVVLSNSAAEEAAEGGVYPAVERAASATGIAIVGAIVGFEPNYDNLSASAYNAASTKRIVYVADAADLVFAAPQDEAGTGAIQPDEVGQNAQIVVGTPATATPYASTMKVDSTVATTSTYPLQVIGIKASPDNSATDTARAAEVLVRINTHAYGAAGLAGV